MPDLIYILGLDPGLSGGLAVVGSDGLAECAKMGSTEKDTFDEIWAILKEYKVRKAYIERASSRPFQGGPSTFTFGMGYGGLRMALIALEIPFEAVAPGVWQRAMGCLSKGNKNTTKARAQELYPQVKVTHAVADALLIATYGLRQVERRE